jgi:DNA-binding NarL/FixJ family response regulator
MTENGHISEITCLVADDHPAVLQAVCDILDASGISIVARAATGQDAAEKIEARRPQVALLDVRMPGLSGIDVARRIGRSAPETAALLYTGLGDKAMLVEALDAGARGFVLKEAPLPDLVRAVETVARGATYVDPVLAGVIASGDIGGCVPNVTK